MGVAAAAELSLWSSEVALTTGPVAIANGVNSFSLATFAGLDLADIQAIRLSIIGVGAGEVPIARDISAVPEPSAALLVALGLAAIASRGRAR